MSDRHRHDRPAYIDRTRWQIWKHAVNAAFHTAFKKMETLTLDWGILENSIGPRVRLLRNTLYSGSISVSEPYGLPTGALTVMALVSANPGSSQSALALQAGITGPSLVGIIDELEKRDLVARVRSTEDRRRNMVVLTDNGKQSMGELFKTVAPIEAPIREALGDKDMQRLTALLDKAIAALTDPVE